MMQLCIMLICIMNPFRFGRVVTGEDFCARPSLVEQLRENLEAGHHVAILGERRTGKTSLVFETARRVRGLRLVYAQLWAVKDVEDVAIRLLRGIVTMQSRSGSFLERMGRALASLRPRVEFDPVTGQPSVTLAPGARLPPSGLHAVFDYLDELGRQHHLAVALDEFQDIRRVEGANAILGEIRGRIQREARVPYVFAGSIRHDMEGIFRHPSSPFFKSLRTLEVPGLPRAEFQRFLDRRFAEGKRRLSSAIYDRLFTLAQDNPSDAQQFCAAVWDTSSTGDDISETSLQAALAHVLASERKSYEAVARQLTGNQARCLRALARVGGERPQSKEFLTQAGIAVPASVQRSLTRLVDLEIVYGPNLRYKFFDPFFRQWVMREL